MARARSSRQADLGDAGIRVLASLGRNGLTHRAVDAEAGLAPGSTSYYARTRDALLELVVERIAGLDMDAAQPGADLDTDSERTATELVDLVTDLVYVQLTRHRDRTLARYELSLEAVHNTRLRAVLNRAGERFRAAAATLVGAAGSRDPVRHGRLLVAICDGLVFDALAGAGSAHPRPRAAIRADVVDAIGGLFGGTPAGSGPPRTR